MWCTRLHVCREHAIFTSNQSAVDYQRHYNALVLRFSPTEVQNISGSAGKNK